MSMFARLLPIVLWMRLHKLNVATYNPLSAADADRKIDIAAETGNFDILALIGTQQRKALDSYHKENIAGRLYLHSGYAKGTHTNRSCGRGLFFGKRTREQHVKKVWTPSSTTRKGGRGQSYF